MSSAVRGRWIGARKTFWAAALAALVALSAIGLWAWRSGRRSGTGDGLAGWPELQKAASGRHWARARPRLEQWLAEHPDHGAARVLLGHLEMRTRRRDAALALWNAVARADPSWAEAQIALGTLAIRERRAADAEGFFRSAAAADPRSLEARRDLLYVLSLEQRAAETRQVLWEIHDIQRDPRVLVDLVLELLKGEDDVRGLAPELELLVAQTPDDPFLRRAWGLAELYRGRAREALPHLEAAADALENDPTGRFALAECSIMLGKPVDVDRALGAAPSRPLDAARWWLARGKIEEALGQTERAAESFECAAKRAPRDREAHHRLGRALKRLGREKPAQAALDQAEALEKQYKALRREHQALRRGGIVPSDPALFEKLAGMCADAGLDAEADAWREHSRALAATERPSRNGQGTRTGPILPGGTGGPPVVESGPPLFATRTTPWALDDPRRASKTRALSPRVGPLQASSSSAADPPPFVEGAEAAGIRFFLETGAKPGRTFIADTMGGGVGLIDYDGDGWLDLYFVNGCELPFDLERPPAPNVLYRNQRDGTFRDVTSAAGVAGRGYGMGCAVADYDNDGHDDLFVTGLKGTLLYRNRGDGTFEDVTTRAGVFSDRWTTAAGFGDLDGDGDLDLVAIAYVDVALDDDRACHDHSGRLIHCSPGFYPAQDDLLYRNNGDGTFTEMSKAAGFVAPNGRGLGLAIADLDGDGRLDLYVANDASPDFLFQNQGNLRFVEIGEPAGTATNGAGRATASMGVVADDLNGDGRIDLFITNLVNESSTLFRNLGGGLFQDATLGAGLDAPSRPRTGFGNAALDFDNDGRLDLFVANGHVDDRPWANSPMAQSPLFFWGRAGGRFDVAAPAKSSELARPFVGRGVAAGDLNNDGRVDLVVVRRDGPAALYWNRSRSGNHWLGVRLRGASPAKGAAPAPRTPIGARVACTAGGRTIVRWLNSGTGYLSSHDPRLWFGLGAAERVDRLEIRWPSGRSQSWKNPPADRIITIEEGRHLDQTM